MACQQDTYASAVVPVKSHKQQKSHFVALYSLCASVPGTCFRILWPTDSLPTPEAQSSKHPQISTSEDGPQFGGAFHSKSSQTFVTHIVGDKLCELSYMGTGVDCFPNPSCTAPGHKSMLTACRRIRHIGPIVSHFVHPISVPQAFSLRG